MKRSDYLWIFAGVFAILTFIGIFTDSYFVFALFLMFLFEVLAFRQEAIERRQNENELEKYRQTEEVKQSA